MQCLGLRGHRKCNFIYSSQAENAADREKETKQKHGGVVTKSETSPSRPSSRPCMSEDNAHLNCSYHSVLSKRFLQPFSYAFPEPGGVVIYAVGKFNFTFTEHIFFSKCT